jgi:Tol biopolymer transport system component
MARWSLLAAAVLAVGLSVPPVQAVRPAPYVAFASNEAGTFDLYLVRLDGSGRRRLTDGPADETSPTWSPDGRRLAFWSKAAGTTDLAVLDLRTGAVTLRQVSDRPDNPHHLFAPSWSPRGDWIAFESNRGETPAVEAYTDLYLVRPDGTGLRRLTSDRVIDAAPSWHPDGRSFVFSQQGGAGANRFPELYRQWLDGRRARLTTDQAHDWEGRWSRDGRSLAFTSNRTTGSFGIHLRRPDGRVLALAAPAAPATGMSASWTPDGRSLAYSYDPDGGTDPSVGYFGGTDLRVVLPGPRPSELHVVGVGDRRDRVLLTSTGSLVTPAVAPR